MRPPAFSLGLLLSASLSGAVKISVKQKHHAGLIHKRATSFTSHKRAPASPDDDDGDIDLSSFHDLLYIANVSVGGTEYPLQLDTGSSDLWVLGSTSTPLTHLNQTSYIANVTYGIGSTLGHIAFTSVEFAGIEVQQQAFIAASHSDNPIVNYGVDGIVGLGFSKLSTVRSTLRNAGLSNGESLLYNLFAQNPEEPNFIAFALERTSEGADDGDEVDGSFTIGEHDPNYAAVAKRPKISTYPAQDPSRWTVLLDGILVGNTSIPLSSTVPNAPSGKSVVMLDSGTSYTYAPTEVCDAIYGQITGAKYSEVLGQYVVPCDIEVDVALQFGNNVYPIHPLDITPLSVSDGTSCLGSFIPQSVSVGAGQFDMLMGDNIMRSFYTVYDFGDYDSSGEMGDPFMQILPLVDPNVASQEFHKIRGGKSSGNITYTAQNVGSSDSSTPTPFGASSVDASSDIASTLNKLQSYIPAMLAVMALNALVILLLGVAGIVYMFRRRTRSRARRNPGRATPVPLQRTSSFGMPIAGGSDQLGTYQPVSMALTEDTFVPPSPAFSKPGFGDNSLRMGDGSMRAGDRPKSVA